MLIILIWQTGWIYKAIKTNFDRVCRDDSFSKYLICVIVFENSEYVHNSFESGIIPTEAILIVLDILISFSRWFDVREEFYFSL